MRNPPVRWLLLSVVIIFIDQLTKLSIMQSLFFDQSVAIFSGFNLTLRYNVGVAFSLLGYGGALINGIVILFALLVVTVIIILLVTNATSSVRYCAALALIAGGALGNLLDRLRLGFVVDFIDIYWRNWHWPAFNVADSMICLGAVLLIIDVWCYKKRH